ncbi:MAG: GNAT family N-acetyltransferase [Pseudomonadota bacterium]|nr:GNAT family N-acetyltransferase [Pseudomonadota bacterium]
MPDMDIRPLESAGIAGAAAWAAAQLRPMPAYISHGEILSGRSPDGKRWADDLDTVLARDFAACLDGGGFVLVACQGDTIAGLCAVAIESVAGNRIATIEDLLVGEDGRGRGLGSRLLEAAEALCRENNADRIMLESGIANDSAHSFFEGRGYRAVSKVFLRKQ